MRGVREGGAWGWCVRFVGCVAFGLALASCASAVSARAIPIPAPLVDDALAPKSDQRVVVFAGGCFWGIQAVFQHVRGVIQATSGYAGGDESTAQYEMVGSGNTGHAESVQVVYDASKITYGTLLRIFFSVAHDPTQLNQQGPDYGTQYRSALFVLNPEQRKIAEAYIAQLDGSAAYGAPIVTQVNDYSGFYPAEDYHQNYATLHPTDPYIMINDAPKVRALKDTFKDIYK